MYIVRVDREEYVESKSMQIGEKNMGRETPIVIVQTRAYQRKKAKVSMPSNYSFVGTWVFSMAREIEILLEDTLPQVSQKKGRSKWYEEEKMR